MNQKEKNKNKFFFKKRFVLSLVFLFLIFSFSTLHFVQADEAADKQMIDAAQDAADSFAGTKDVSTATKSSGSWFLWVFNALLYAALRFILLLVSIAGNIFDWIVNAENFKAVMEMSAIVQGWRLVRDFLNLFFILVLLFSAFCTIFQVDKYNIKKILLTLVIMALLVNFSFPIARFIIDLANVPMYYFFQSMGNVIGGEGKSISVALSNSSNLQKTLLPNFSAVNGQEELTFQLITAIVFAFLFGITLLVVAILLVIRTVVLALLIIFSPAGFVPSILPGTKMAGYADQWWTALFKQSFFGTVMAFMLYLSIMILNEAQNNIFPSMEKSIGNGLEEAIRETIVRGSILIIPIILLWSSIMIAQSMGAYGAKQVGGKASKFATWAGKAPWRLSKWGVKAGANATGIPGGIQKKYSNLMSGFKASRSQREARIAASGPFKVKGAELQDINNRSEEYKKNHESIESLKQKASAGDAAAALRLATDGDIDSDTYRNIMNKTKSQSVKDLITRKTREKRVDTVARYRIEVETEERAKKIAGSSSVTDGHRRQAREEIAEDEIGKIAPSKWKDQNIKALAGYDDKTKNYILSKENKAIIRATKKVYKSTHKGNQRKIIEDMQGDKYGVGKKLHIWP